MPRLFTAIELPAEVTADLSALRGGLPGARWIDPQNYHLTLRFIGDVDGPTANEVMHVLHRVERPSFDVRLSGLDQFGGRKPRSVFAVATGDPLVELQAEHERLLRRIGLEPESRKYTPHVTLARLKDASTREVADYLASRGAFRSAPFRVPRFVVYSSRASVGGGPYVLEAAYSLAA
jgi:2'-5' RNA ligase